METTATAVTLDEMSHSLILFGGKRVVDQTGLKGRYDFKLTWRFDRPEIDDTGNSSDAPVLSTALREQLGLQLVPSKAPVEVLVVDRIELPTEVAEANAAPPPPPPPKVFQKAGSLPRFEVASVRQNKTEVSPVNRPYTNFPLTGNSRNGGYFIARNLPVFFYLQFAYKDLSASQLQAVLKQLPDWTSKERCDIER
jgi:hypothetical protein